MFELTITPKDLLEGFLLPSLLIALLWLSNHIRSDNSPPENALQLLHALIKPTSGSFEAREIHQTIVSIAADPIKQTLQSAKPPGSKPVAQAILKLLDSYSNFKRSFSITRTEMDVWCSTSGGLPSTIQHAFQTLIFWDSTEMSTSPPAFTFKLFNMAIRLHGVTRFLHLLLNELKIQHANGTYDLALDVLFAIICSPTSSTSFNSNSQSQGPSAARLTLSDALRLEYSANLSRYLKNSDTIIAEALVRLNRRLETHSLVVLPQSMDAAAEAEAEAAAAAVGVEMSDMPDDLDSIDLSNITNMQGGASNTDMNTSLNNAAANNDNNANENGGKDLIDQILESSNNNNQSTSQTNQSNNQNNSNGNNNAFDLNSNDLSTMFVDLDSANLGLGNDFDLEMDGMF